MTTVQALQSSLADTTALYSKVHSFHWNVTGPRFQELHLFFETLYTTLWTQIDELAEQIRIQGEMAPKSYSEMRTPSTIQEEQEIPNADEMLVKIGEGLEQLIHTLDNGVKAAGEEGNDAVEGFLLDILTGHQKTLWMAKSMQ